MIRQSTVKTLVPKVVNAVEELFKSAQGHEQDNNDFLLFLTNGHLDKNDGYVIGPGRKGLQDYDRMEFFEQYAHWPLESEYGKIKDTNAKLHFERSSIHLEMMMYCHFWESDPNLKTLKQLANLIDSQPYDWDIEIPDFNRHKFIRDKIRDVFKKHNLAFANIMSNSYRSQLRNAFAHSNYYFRMRNIGLSNYKGEHWEIEELSFEEWEERFIMTALIFDSISKMKMEGKKVLAKSGNNLGVWIPIKRGKRRVYLEYYPEQNTYRFPLKR